MENWLLVGSGGREYSLAKKLAENGDRNVYVAPGNPMMNQLTNVGTVDIDEMDFAGLVEFAQQNHVDWTIVGPEAPLSMGIVDAFRERGLNIFGPTKVAAQLESSKAFAKQIMQKRGVKTAAYQEFNSAQAAIAFVQNGAFPIVIKANGLAAGKGVIIAKDEQTAVDSIHHLFEINPDSEVLIEEFMTGQEFSFIVMANGTEVVPMQIAQDHKRLLNGDRGPNTGGMGAYSPVPQFSQAVVDAALQDVIMPVLSEMKEQGHPFTGFLYAGLIQTATGTKVVEFNVRMGDPETQVILPQLESDLGTVIEQLMAGRPVTPKWQHDRFYLGAVIAAAGYPGKHRDHLALPSVSDQQISISYAGVTEVDQQLVSSGGRVLMLIASDPDLKRAQAKVNSALDQFVNSDDYEYRTDIGSKAFK
ncbi:phosphoribosylamine--glycine ligase [Nicoliella spurrieriana]|uniref:Phosphoribosylamine--glycine ligase n=1 Tax=Nicoliella spurrieriana TaxID=2925830 RepID=A0A976RS34_9LACO|nr:phosphoribosylamine--glycine ligase [Nicoliella spurrieriana]UQS86741.1 phosphoribosylamine--glycine ligase [Nicoliella spurrieriana]